MQFLKTLLWIVFAVAVAIFFYANKDQVATIFLWGGLELDVKLPVLILASFLVGFLPTFILHRARIWTLRRRYESQVQSHVANHAPAPGRQVPADNAPANRRAGDSKAWPAS